MSTDALVTLINDHLAGASTAIPLAQRCRDRNAGTPLGAALAQVVNDIQEDRQQLERMVEALGSSSSITKKAAGWLTEKAAQVRLLTAGAHESALTTVMELEALVMGVHGKQLLWEAMAEVQPRYPALAPFNYVTLLHRAQAQQQALSEHHAAASRQAL